MLQRFECCLNDNGLLNLAYTCLCDRIFVSFQAVLRGFWGCNEFISLLLFLTLLNYFVVCDARGLDMVYRYKVSAIDNKVYG